MKAKGKHIIVTGGGGGVGRELVLQLLEKGATVFAVDINQEALIETEILAHSNRFFSYVVDISKKEAVFDFAQQVVKDHGTVDAVINNAGIIQPFLHLDQLEMDRIERVMDINFYGTLYMVKALLPHLLTRPEAHIVNVSSMGGFLPVPGQSIYGASKAAVKLLSEGLSSELKDTCVKVSVIIPGGIATDIKKNSDIEYKVSTKQKGSNMVLTPHKAAYLILSAMENNQLRKYIGTDCQIMRFLYQLSPRMAMGMINKVMGSREH